MQESQPERKCPKCGGEMEVGFLRDRSQSWNRMAEWIQGVPETSWTGNVKVNNSRRYAIEAFRCESCGFLEHYAVVAPPTSFLGT